MSTSLGGGEGDVTRDCDIFMNIMFPWLLHIRDVAYLGRGGGLRIDPSYYPITP